MVANNHDTADISTVASGRRLNTAHSCMRVPLTRPARLSATSRAGGLFKQMPTLTSIVCFIPDLLPGLSDIFVQAQVISYLFEANRPRARPCIQAVDLGKHAFRSSCQSFCCWVYSIHIWVPGSCSRVGLPAWKTDLDVLLLL